MPGCFRWGCWRGQGCGLPCGVWPGFCAPALVLFFFAGAALWLWFAVSRPVFLRWDEFSFWGTACKMTKVNHCLHPAAPGNLSARAYLPGMMVLSYLFQFFSAGFTEWECLAAYDLLALAVFAAFGAFEGRKWYLSALGMLGAGLLPYFFLAPGDTQAATVYLNAMGDVYLGLTFGGALCLYYRAGTRKAGLVLTALALAFLTLIKDMGFAYALIAAALICADRLFAQQKPTLPALGRTVGLGAALCVPVLALFLGWNRYVLTAAGIDKSAGVGAAGSQVSYFGMLTDGALQFVGRGDPARAEKFGQVKAAMMAAFTGAPLCLLGYKFFMYFISMQYFNITHINTLLNILLYYWLIQHPFFLLPPLLHPIYVVLLLHYFF